MEIGGNYIKGFDTDNHLTNEVKLGLKDNYISQEEADFMVKIIDHYGRKNIKITQTQLIKLGKEFGLDYTRISKMGPVLERKLRERDNIKKITKNNLSNLKKHIETSGNSINKLLDFISLAEGTRGEYNIRYGHKRTPNLSKMTINQVIYYQSKLRGHTAIGKYQIKKSTLELLKKSFGGNKKMTNEIQDKMAIKLLKIRGLEKYLKGRINLSNFQNRLAHEWASLPMANGKSAYQGDNAGNHSRISSYEFRKKLRNLKS